MTDKREARITLEALAVMSGKQDISDCCYLGKKPRKTIQHEAQIQAALFEWAKLAAGQHPELKLMFHIANEGKRNAVTGYRLKQCGLKAGVPDICLPVARGRFHALYIELKAESGRLQENQRAWIDELNKQGHKAVVCYGFDEAKTAIESYLSLGQLKSVITP